MLHEGVFFLWVKMQFTLRKIRCAECFLPEVSLVQVRIQPTAISGVVPLGRKLKFSSIEIWWCNQHVNNTAAILWCFHSKEYYKLRVTALPLG